MQRLVGLWQQHLHRLDEAEPDDPADVATRRRDEPGLLERPLARDADIRLAVDERAVAIEHGKADHESFQRIPAS